MKESRREVYAKLFLYLEKKSTGNALNSSKKAVDSALDPRRFACITHFACIKIIFQYLPNVIFITGGLNNWMRFEVVTDEGPYGISVSRFFKNIHLSYSFQNEYSAKNEYTVIPLLLLSRV